MAKFITFDDDARRRITRAVRSWETNQGAQMRAGVTGSGPGIDYSCVSVLNVTGSTWRRGDVVKLSGLDFTSSVEADIRSYSATYSVAQNDDDPLGVAISETDSLETSRVQFAGVATVYATISDSIERPYLAPGSGGKLKPSWWGQFEIVYADQSTNGEKLVLARICATQTPIYKARTKATVYPNTNGVMGLCVNNVEVETVDAAFNWMEGTTSLANGTECLIRWFPEERRWVIIEAEC